jgi:hypothetical protein
MPKLFPEEEKIRVRELAADGLSHKEIARHMKEEYPDNWSSDYAHRTVSRIIKDGETDSDFASDKTLDEMSREERFKFIENRLQSSPRFKMAFKNFDTEEKRLFIEEYLDVIKSTDTLTEVEEQAVFAAILEFVLAFQALNRKEIEEKLRDQSMSGDIPEGDPRFRRHVDDKYQKEYDQHMKLYQKGMEQLKMSRQQRLKEVRSQKVTLVDLAEMLSNKNAQAEVADEIENLAKLKDSELVKLLEEGHIHGIFEDYN